MKGFFQSRVSDWEWRNKVCVWEKWEEQAEREHGAIPARDFYERDDETVEQEMQGGKKEIQA